MSDGMYEALSGRGKNKVPREVQINKDVDIILYKDSIIITNKKQNALIALKTKTLKKILKEVV